ncbi:hypothetical protein GCM10007049_31650 [Echinicola pacifica]|uniref:Uncharacterized protein n=1 Tax=Echinicola pacifica TaxID=346377 RepID=A0A918Q8X3_9BACT|nr:hypothetical protein [Echinicola pacifica]GGZ36023.1 hypothetical protein GCM10007049_31650 [Echinicola pacifica]
MKFVDDILKKLFTDKSAAVTHKENFTPSQSEMAETYKWSQSAEGQQLFDLLYQNIHLQKAGEIVPPELQIFRSPYANGLALFYEAPLDSESFSHLFFAFGQRIVDLGYERVSLDRTIQEKPTGVNITEKQYLKPKTSYMAERTEQLFGNVAIEKVSVNHQPQMIKILVTIYSDRLYTKARSFDTFVESLFNPQ